MIGKKDTVAIFESYRSILENLNDSFYTEEAYSAAKNYINAIRSGGDPKGSWTDYFVPKLLPRIEPSRREAIVKEFIASSKFPLAKNYVESRMGDLTPEEFIQDVLKTAQEIEEDDRKRVEDPSAVNMGEGGVLEVQPNRQYPE